MKKEMEKLELDLLYGHWGWEKILTILNLKENQSAFLLKSNESSYQEDGEAPVIL